MTGPSRHCRGRISRFPFRVKAGLCHHELRTCSSPEARARRRQAPEGLLVAVALDKQAEVRAGLISRRIENRDKPSEAGVPRTGLPMPLSDSSKGGSQSSARSALDEGAMSSHRRCSRRPALAEFPPSSAPAKASAGLRREFVATAVATVHPQPNGGKSLRKEKTPFAGLS